MRFLVPVLLDGPGVAYPYSFAAASGDNMTVGVRGSGLRGTLRTVRRFARRL